MLLAAGRSRSNPCNRSRRARAGVTILAVVSSFAAIPAAHPAPASASLSYPTKEAYERYVALTDARNVAEVREGGPFLWVDTLPEARREETYNALKRGEVVIERLETRDKGDAISCPGGLIHHWVGALWIPGATLSQTLALVQDYDQHAQVYSPLELRSRILERNGDDFKVSIRYLRKKVISVVLDTVLRIDYHTLDATHAWSRARMESVREIKDHDTPHEYALPEGNDGGYLWGMTSYWRFVEREGGTFVESESISLSTRVPVGLGWLVEPFIKSVPRESVRDFLNATRKGVLQPPGSCPNGC
jgi:hypothetical protein